MPERLLSVDTWLAIRWVGLGGLALAVAAWDLRSRIIPNALVAAGLGFGVAVGAATGSIGPALLGSAVLGGPMVLLWWIGAAPGGRGLVGAGDAKAALAFGALLGMPSAVAGLWWGALAGGALALGAVLAGLWRTRRALLGALRRHGLAGWLAAVATHPVWAQGVPYGAALAAGSVAAAALLWR